MPATIATNAPSENPPSPRWSQPPRKVSGMSNAFTESRSATVCCQGSSAPTIATMPPSAPTTGPNPSCRDLEVVTPERRGVATRPAPPLVEDGTDAGVADAAAVPASARPSTHPWTPPPASTCTQVPRRPRTRTSCPSSSCATDTASASGSASTGTPPAGTARVSAPDPSGPDARVGDPSTPPDGTGSPNASGRPVRARRRSQSPSERPGTPNDREATAPRRSSGDRRCGRSVLLDELDERAERRLRVHEGDGRPAAARAGSLVDHAVASGLDPLERLPTVGDPVADVVQALALRLQVLRDRRVVAG